MIRKQKRGQITHNKKNAILRSLETNREMKEKEELKQKKKVRYFESFADLKKSFHEHA